MSHRRLAFAALALMLVQPAFAAPDHAANVTITRDDWGIAHVKGKTDADAVFGMAYAQAEDDFNRVERNYLIALGRTAEADGAASIWADLRQRLFLDHDALKADYARSPDWLKKLMDAWAEGLNFYLAKHPEVKPAVITRFEPWMALSFSEGSIGGDIENVPLTQLENFYGRQNLAMTEDEKGLLFKEPTGSNGIAIAPKRSESGNALLWINPHTSFFFRSELQMTSDEGLDAYGAVTWGQFFIYQGFNAKAGWMHTSSTIDNIDEFAETVTPSGAGYTYRYGTESRKVAERTVTLFYKGADGSMKSRNFRTFSTHHGPIVREDGGKWIAFALLNNPVDALQQSFLRTKTHDLADFMKVAELKANSSNNTLFADSKGEIAYLHPQFVPIRDDRFNYKKPVDGSDPATDWKGLHKLADLPQAVNPGIGWAYNTNNGPWSAAGPDSPTREAYPKYMDRIGETPRGIHASTLLADIDKLSAASLTKLAFDSWLPAFDVLLPALKSSFDALPAGDPAKAMLAGPAALLAGWDRRWGYGSEATSLAVFYGEALWRASAQAAEDEDRSVYDEMARATDAQRIAALDAAVDRLTADFGGWRVKWSEINRYQRNDGAIVQRFDDAKPSTPIPFASGQWGSLASFGAKRYPGTKRYYGTSGNSFLAAVEFGPRVSAHAVSIGGESGHPDSPHFADQVARYAAGDLREVYFYPDQLEGHVERVYRPGE